MSPTDPRHGTPAGGRVHRQHGEKPCRPCADAEARYERGRSYDTLTGRPRAISDLGTRRRVQALVALGHSFARIAEGLGVTQAAACKLAHRPKAYTRAATAAKVAALYDAWSMQLPPQRTRKERHAASYARTVARKHGWLPPLAWDDIDHQDRPTPPDVEADLVDDAVVERILAGDPVPATTAERRAVVARWHETGLPLRHLRILTGWKLERYQPPTDTNDTTDQQGDTAA